MKTCFDIICDRNVIWIEVIRKRIEPGMIQNVDSVNQLEMSIVNQYFTLPGRIKIQYLLTKYQRSWLFQYNVDAIWYVKFGVCKAAHFLL